MSPRRTSPTLKLMTESDVVPASDGMPRGTEASPLGTPTAGLAWDGLPGIPASAGALVWDAEGRFLILAPTYKTGWTIPGGVMEADETPWEGCCREVFEETGITVTQGRLLAVDTRPAKRTKALGLRFLFDCGVVSAADIQRITVQEEEVHEYRFATPDEALPRLRPAVRRRVGAALAASACVYLEDGSPLDRVT